MKDIQIRKATPSDYDSIWLIIKQIIKSGDTYVFAPDSDRDKMLDFWCNKNNHTYVAVYDDKITGTFFIRDNNPDLGSHVANAAYMTMKEAAGKGIGYEMGKFSLKEAKKLGYKAMQFNYVIEDNKGAVKLWKKLGFEIVGEIPEAFDHSEKGYTGIYIMWRKL